MFSRSFRHNSMHYSSLLQNDVNAFRAKSALLARCSFVPFKHVTSMLVAGGLCSFGTAVLAEDTAANETDNWPSNDRIVIVGHPSNVDTVPGSAALIDLETLQKQEFTDIHRILRAVPGVNLQEEDGFGLRPNIGLRGTGLDRSAKITLMEDGVLMAPAPYAAPSAYYFPHAGRMAGVEVVKGAAGIKYGPRTQGGSINLLSTPVPDDLSAYGSFKYGDHNTRSAHVWAGVPVTGQNGGIKTIAMLEIYSRDSDGFKTLDNGGNTGFHIEDYVGKLRFESADGARIQQSLELKLQYSDELSNETYLGLTEVDFAASPFRRYNGSQLDQMDAEHSEISARYRADLGAGWDVTMLAYSTKFARDWFKLDRVNASGTLVNSGKSGSSISSILRDPVAYAAEYEVLLGGAGFVSADGALMSKHNNREYYAKGIQGILGWQGEAFGADHNLELSLRLHKDEMDRFQWRDRFKVDNGTMVLTGGDTRGTESNRIDAASAIAFYAQDQIEKGKWTFVPGLRFESIDLSRDDFGKSDPARTGASLKQKDNQVTAFVPGFGAIYALSDTWSLFGGVHKGFAPPGPGKTNTDAETATNWEFGTRWSQAEMRFEATAFYNAFGNMIGTVTASTGGGGTIGDQFDAGEVDVMGLEFSGETDLATHMTTDFEIPIRFAYTYTDATFQNSFDSSFDPWGEVQAGDMVPYIPAHQFSGSIGLQNETMGFELAASLIGEVRTNAGQGAIAADELVEGHSIVDAAAWYEPMQNVKLSVSARNLGDETYAAARRPAGLRPGLPRTVLFGISLNY